MSEQIPKLKLVIRQPPASTKEDANEVNSLPPKPQKTFPFPMIPPIDTSLSSKTLLQEDNKLRRRLLPAIESIPRTHWTDLSLLTRTAIADSLESLETISEVYFSIFLFVEFSLDRFPRMDQVERKRQLINWSLRQRETFHKLLVLWRWSPRMVDYNLVAVHWINFAIE